MIWRRIIPDRSRMAETGAEMRVQRKPFTLSISGLR